MKRRVFLKGSFAAGTIAVAAAAGLLTPRRVLAASWPETAFDAKNEADAVKALFGDMPVVDSDAISIKAPLQAENGAVVPIKAWTSLSNVESIAIVVEKNPAPWATSVEVMPGAGGLYSTRIKMGQTSPVTCYVKAGGKIHKAAHVVKVTVGGCGG